MMSFHRRLWSALPLAFALSGGVIGCAAEGGPIEAPDSTSAAEESQSAAHDDPDAPAGLHIRRAHGPEHLLIAAIHELDLTDAQRAAIQGAIDKLPGGPRPHAHKGGVPFEALAEGVRAGAIDTAAVLARVGGEDRGLEEHRAAVAGALQALHATLTKEQRRALVGAMAQRMEEHSPKGERIRRKGDHGPGGERPDQGGPLGHLLEGLDLTDEQRGAIDRALEAQRPAGPDREVMKEGFVVVKRHDMRARLDGFAADTFDAKAFLAPPEGADARGKLKEHLERMVKDLAVVVPHLQPAQREALAARLEKGPPVVMMRSGKRGPAR